VNTRATLGLTAGTLVIGLLAGLGLGHKDTGTKAPVGPGPSKMNAGVPVGYAHTKAGAIAAAAGYSHLISELALSGENDRQHALAMISTETGQSAMRAKAQSAFAVIDKGLGLPEGKSAVVLRSAAVGYKLVAFTPNAATIDVWTVDVVGKSDAVPPQAGWGVATIDLKWESADWKLASFPAQLPGPSPALQGAPSTVADLARIRGLEELPNGPIG
jgi:hypothetical protein